MTSNSISKTESLWSNSCALPSFSSLQSDTKTDVLIIGGGIAGILCAYLLEQSGVNYLLAEADRICSGVTQNTTAKITSQHGLFYHKLIQRFGMEKAALYLEANQNALRKYEELCSRMDCDFEHKDAFLYSRNDTAALDKELNALHKLNFCAEFSNDLPLPFQTVGAVCFPKQAQFHPLKFIRAVSENLNIFEQTRVIEIDGNTARTCHAKITAEKIIVATHFPFLNTHGSYFLKLYQQRSYVIAYKAAPDLDGMYIEDRKNGLSFRNHKDLLLIGGGGHRTGKSGGNWKEISALASSFYPTSTEYCRWATQDCMSLDGIPYIGNYSKNTPNLYVASGFNKWGMTSSLVAAMLLTDLITGKGNPYADVFSPSRSILRPQLAINASESSLNLIKPTVPRCPHMGCALKWNHHEHSWDCPCHGSRFDKEGELLNNPATGRLKRKNNSDAL